MLQRVRGIDHHIDDELDAITASAEETERELKVTALDKATLLKLFLNE